MTEVILPLNTKSKVQIRKKKPAKWTPLPRPVVKSQSRFDRCKDGFPSSATKGCVSPVWNEWASSNYDTKKKKR